MRVAALLVAPWLLGAVARAHDVVPTSLTLRPGGEDFVYVADQGTCHADITIHSLDPGVLEVFAVDMSTFHALTGNGLTATVPNRIDQVFLVRAKPNATAPIQAALSVCWVGVGKDAQGGSCTENNCPNGHVVPVSVEADPLTHGATAYSGVARDPVDTASGELFETELPDLDLGGPMRLAFERYYASRLASEGNATSTLGPNWTHGFAWRLVQTGWNIEIYDSRGRVIRFEKGFNASTWAPALYETIPYQLVPSGPSWKLVDPTDNSVRTFDSAGRLTQVEDGVGNAHVVTYAGSLIASVADGLGRVLTFTHTAGRLTRVSDGTRHVDFTYDGQGRLATYSDADAKTTTYAYDAAFPADALLTAKTLPEGNTPYSQTWDAQQRVATQTDADGNTFTFTYGASTAVGDPLGGSAEFTHDADVALVSLQDEAGELTSVANDSKGRRKSIDDRLGDTTSWTRHAASGRLASVTEADGSKTTYAWTKRSSGELDFFDLASISRPNGTSESFTHDASGHLTQAIDGAGEAWSYTYNASGQLLTATDPTGAVTTLAYNADGTLASVTDGASQTTSFGYDALRRVTTITYADASTTLFTYDALDRVTSVTDELARTTTFTYDDNGNVASLTNPDSETTSFTYDGLDRPIGMSNAEGSTVALAYEERGLLETLTNGESEATTIGRDARGRPATLADPLGDTWALSTDHEALLVGVVDPLTNARVITRDSRGRPIAIESPLGNVTRFSWDALGRLSRVTDAKGKLTKLTRDGNGELTALELPIANGKVTATRDASGRITKLAYPGSREWTWSYDAAGRPASATDPLGNTTSASWDNRNRPQTLTLPGALGTVTATWNAAGQLTDLIGSDGASARYAYDAAGRLVDGDGVTFAYDDAGRLVDSDGIATVYDDANRPVTKTLAPGKVVTYAYDSAGRLETVTDWLGGVTTFTWDAAGRVTEIARPNGVVTRYTYDADSRVTLIEEIATAPSTDGEVPIAVTTLTHDQLDRVASVDVSGLVSTLPTLGQALHGFNAGGQLTGATYDARGLLLVDGMRTNTWNNLGQLTSSDDGVTTRQFEYNGLGDLSAVEVVGVDRLEFARDYAAYGANALGGAIMVVTKSGADESYYVRTPAGEPLYSVDASNDAREYFHFDYRGSTHFLTDDSAAITVHYSYAPLGAVISQSGASLDEFTVGARFGTYTPRGADFSFVGSRPFDLRTGLSWKPETSRPFDARASNPYVFDATPYSRFASPLERPQWGLAAAAFDGAATPGRGTSEIVAALGGLTWEPPTSLRDTCSISCAAYSDWAAPVESQSRSDYGAGFSPVTMASSGFEPAHGYAFSRDPGLWKLGASYAIGLRSQSGSLESAVRVPEGSYREVVEKLRARFAEETRIRQSLAREFATTLAAPRWSQRAPTGEEFYRWLWRLYYGDFGTFAVVLAGLDVPPPPDDDEPPCVAFPFVYPLARGWTPGTTQEPPVVGAIRARFGF